MWILIFIVLFGQAVLRKPKIPSRMSLDLCWRQLNVVYRTPSAYLATERFASCQHVAHEITHLRSHFNLASQCARANFKFIFKGLKLVEEQSSIANGHHPSRNQTVPTALQFVRLVNLCRSCNDAFTLLEAHLLTFLFNCRQLDTEKS